MAKVRLGRGIAKRSAQVTSGRAKIRSAIVPTASFVPESLQSPIEPSGKRGTLDSAVRPFPSAAEKAPSVHPYLVAAINRRDARLAEIRSLCASIEHDADQWLQDPANKPPPSPTPPSYRIWRLKKAEEQTKGPQIHTKAAASAATVNLERQTISAGARDHIQELVQGKVFDLLRPSILDQATISPPLPRSAKRLREVFAAPIPAEAERSARRLFRPALSVDAYRVRQSTTEPKSPEASTGAAAEESEPQATPLPQCERPSSPALSIYADEESIGESESRPTLGAWSDVSSDEGKSPVRARKEAAQEKLEESAEFEDFTVVVVPSVHDRLGPPVANEAVPSKVAKKLRKKERQRMNKLLGRQSVE